MYQGLAANLAVYYAKVGWAFAKVNLSVCCMLFFSEVQSWIARLAAVGWSARMHRKCSLKGMNCLCVKPPGKSFPIHRQ